MIDFSTLKELYIDGKKVTSLFLDGHEVPFGEEPEVNWIRFTTLESSTDPFRLALVAEGTPPEVGLEYSLDGRRWNDMTYHDINYPLTVDNQTAGATVYIRASQLNPTFAYTTGANYWRFVTDTAAFELDGDLKYLIDPAGQTLSCEDRGLYRLFQDNMQVHKISNLSLSMDKLGNYAASQMFNNCQYLSAGDMYIMPQTVSKEATFASMFENCRSLTSAPDLSIKYLNGRNTYIAMFRNCSSLSAGPYVHASSYTGTSLAYIFDGCTSLTSISVDFQSFNSGWSWIGTTQSNGIFTCPSPLGTDATIQRGNNRCPDGWLVANYNVNGYDMDKAFIRGSYTSAFLEDGSSHVPDIAALSVFNGQTAERLYDMTQYTVQLPADTTTAGTKTVQFDGTGVYFNTKELFYKIVAKNLSNCTKTVSSVYDNDEVSYLEVVQPDIGYTLVEGTDYTVAVSTSGNRSTVTITGINGWTGTYTTTVAYKTSGASPITVYKNDSSDIKPLKVTLRNQNFSENISLQCKVDSNAWTAMNVDTQLTASSQVQIRAVDANRRLATGDNNYLWIDTGYDDGTAAAAAVSGNIMSLVDRSETQDRISADYTFANTFANNDNLIDASHLSCSQVSSNMSRAFRAVCASRGMGFGILDGNPSQLTGAPDLFANVSAYGNRQYQMGDTCRNCTALTSVSMTIPAFAQSTSNSYTIGNACFEKCTSLISAVVKSHNGDGYVPSYFKCLEATFQNCSNLTCISTDLTAWPSNGFNEWVKNVAAAGTFICPEALGTDATIQRGTSYCPTGWTVVNYDANLKFTAEQANSTVALSAIGTPPSVSLLKSTDGETWTSYTVNDTVTLADIGDYVCFKADSTNNAFASSSSNYNQFVMTGKIAASGSIMKLLGKDTLSDYAFAKMFAGCSALTQAPKLPATTLASNCYSYMFQNCTSLTSAPELPATTLADSCYRGMLGGCTALSVAPALPATTLAEHCYQGMLNGCTSLTAAPALPATTLADHCYYSMFNDCTSLTAAPALPATTLADSCYYWMFKGCTSLSTAPALPATTVKDNSYTSMFNGCTSLTAAPALPATTLADNCYQSMFQGCTSLSTAPALPATTVKNYSYSSMFKGCSSLSSMNVKFTAWSPSSATDNWLSGVAATGTFTCKNDLDTSISDASHVPAGWTVVNPTVKYADYVQTNNYVLDTLYKPTVNTSLSTCLSGNANGNCFIGFSYNDSQDYRLFNYQNWLYFDMGNGRLGGIFTQHWNTSKWTDISAWNFGLKFTPEGESEYSTTGTRHSTADWDANGTINIAGNGAGSNGDINIKFLKIYENGVLVRDFKAAVDGNDAACLYDEVEEVFYYPTGGAWTAHTDGDDIDTDGDGYSDAEEKAAGSDPEDPASTPDDIDGDGWSNDDEIMYGTDPTDPMDNPDTRDSDSDGWTDGEEIKYGTDPNDPSSNPDNQDSDADGISDGDEIRIYNTNPNNPDSDFDGWTDGEEINAGTDPNDPDSHPEKEPEEEP